MPEKLYTAAQIGELMGGKSARTVRQMIAKGCFGDTVQDGKQHLALYGKTRRVRKKWIGKILRFGGGQLERR